MDENKKNKAYKKYEMAVEHSNARQKEMVDQFQAKFLSVRKEELDKVEVAWQAYMSISDEQGENK